MLPRYGPDVDKYTDELSLIMESFKKFDDPIAVYRVRNKFSAMHSILRRKHKDRSHLLVQVAMCLFKQHLKKYDLEFKSSKKITHNLTDHAFTRALQRLYGIDIDKLKDYVVADIQSNREFELIRATDSETIVTILKKASNVS